MRFPLLLVIVFLVSCKAKPKRIKYNHCFNNNFSQTVTKLSLSDKKRIKELNGKYVELEGYFSYYFEDVALYPSKWSQSKKGLWLNFINDVDAEMLDKMNGRTVVVVGKVDTAHRGHYGAYLGALDSVFCIKEK